MSAIPFPVPSEQPQTRIRLVLSGHPPRPSPSTSPTLRPFPSLPFELTHAILTAAADKAYHSDEGFRGIDDQVEVYRFLRNAALVCNDFRMIVTPLLYRHVVVTSPSLAHRLLETLVHAPLRLSLIRSFEWPAWDRDPTVKTNYPAVTQLRAKLIELLLPSATLHTCVFPTIAWPLLATTDQTSSSLHVLGTVLAIQNEALSNVLDCPRFQSLQELRLWWGDPSSGDVRLPPLLRSLYIRCDTFDHGNNIPLAPFAANQARHLPHLTHLAFSFTTIVYPNAARPPPTPALLTAVGATLTHLTLLGDRDAKAENLYLPSGLFAFCQKLRVLELGNHRPLPRPSDPPASSASLERIDYRFDDWYALDDAHVCDRLALNDIRDAFVEHGARFPKLKTLVLAGVPEMVTAVWRAALETLVDVERLGAAVVDHRGRSLDVILGGGTAASLPPLSTSGKPMSNVASRCSYETASLNSDSASPSPSEADTAVLSSPAHSI